MASAKASIPAKEAPWEVEVVAMCARILKIPEQLPEGGIDLSSIRVHRLAPDLPLPERASPGSAGVDLRAALENPRTLQPGERALIPTGLRLEIPHGFEAQVRPRSGLALRKGVTVLNSPGTIDSDYRGEVGVILINLSQEPVTFERGDRIAQLVVARVEDLPWEEATDLAKSDRGECGFGSSGHR